MMSNFQVGDKLDCRTNWGEWYEAEILKHKQKGESIPRDAKIRSCQQKTIKHLENLELIFVHYLNCIEAPDQWIAISQGQTICDCNSQCMKDKTKHILAPCHRQSKYRKPKKTEKTHNKQLAEFTVHVNQLGLCSFFVSLWSLISSGLASLAFTQNWFHDNNSRGSFIILMGLSSLVMRCIVVLYARKCGEKGRYLALIFIAIASFSDSIFDIIQGFVLISGYQYSTSTNVILLIGTWIGFTDELLEFIEEVIANCCMLCEQEFCIRAFKIWLFSILMDCVTEQICGICIASVALSNNTDITILIFVISIMLNIFAIMMVIGFVVYLLYGGRKRIEQLQQELNGNREIDLNLEHTVVMFGESGVGKTQLVMRWITGDYVDEYDVTIEDSYRKSMVVDNKRFCLNILDTSGIENISSMMDGNWISEGDGFMLVYSINSRDTFDIVMQYREKISRSKDLEDGRTVPMILIGNKCDLENQRQVGKDEGKRLAKGWNCPFLETSAKDRINVSEAWNTYARQMFLKDERILQANAIKESIKDLRKMQQEDSHKCSCCDSKKNATRFTFCTIL